MQNDKKTASHTKIGNTCNKIAKRILRKFSTSFEMAFRRPAAKHLKKLIFGLRDIGWNPAIAISTPKPSES